MGAFPFAPAHNRRKSAKSAVRDSPVSGIRGQHSGSMGVHLEVFTQRATQASPRHRFIEPTAPGRSHWYPFRSSAGRRHNLRKSAKSAVRDSPVSGIRGQHSGSMVVCLEVFTQRATQASPLHRFIEPTAPGRSHWYPFRSSAGRHRHNLRKSANSAVRCSRCPGWSRSTFVVDGGSPGGVYEPGDACVAPTQIGPYPPGLAYRGVSWGSFRSSA